MGGPTNAAGRSSPYQRIQAVDDDGTFVVAQLGCGEPFREHPGLEQPRVAAPAELEIVRTTGGELGDAEIMGIEAPAGHASRVVAAQRD